MKNDWFIHKSSFQKTFCKSKLFICPLSSQVEAWYLYYMVIQNMLRTHEGKKVILAQNKNDLWLLWIKSNALNRSNNRYCSLLALLFSGYHLIWVYMVEVVILLHPSAHVTEKSTKCGIDVKFTSSSIYGPRHLSLLKRNRAELSFLDRRCTLVLSRLFGTRGGSFPTWSREPWGRMISY